MPTAVVAIGGNSLIRAGEKGTIAEQMANVRRTADALVAMIAEGYDLVITHGNGPQVGAALLRSERAGDEAYRLPLDVCVAATQGEIGYLLQQALTERLAKAGLRRPVVSLLTQAVVSRDDPAMAHPTKPIGPFYSQRDAEARRAQFGWAVVDDAARGWRRVVPSPEPTEILEEGAIRTLVRSGALVIACGGGGIPVVRENGHYSGVDAVIDKDSVSVLLALRLQADLLVIATEVDRVYVNYRRPDERGLECIDAPSLRRLYEAGQFPPGNMGPKIAASLRFVENGGARTVITSYERLIDAIHGRAGTHVVPAPAARPGAQQSAGTETPCG
ncbi:MAG TPA: carbamate kinase [Vicinamibacterales bacterium]|nr:carbamate kinase [Vicinamibacterales bacterium]